MFNVVVAGIVGFILYRIVAPSGPAKSVWDMARRWMALGLFGATVGSFRAVLHGGDTREALITWVIACVSASIIAAIGGALWGLIKFKVRPGTVNAGKAAIDAGKQAVSHGTSKMGIFKSSAEKVNDSLDDERLYEIAGTELVANNVRAGLWAKALAESDGDENRTRARYIQLRVQQLKIERDAAIEAMRVANQPAAPEASVENPPQPQQESVCQLPSPVMPSLIRWAASGAAAGVFVCFVVFFLASPGTPFPPSFAAVLFFLSAGALAGVAIAMSK